MPNNMYVSQMKRVMEKYLEQQKAGNAQIIRNREYYMPEIAEENILAEPIHRNTAPSVAWAAHRIAHINPYANVIVTPADQMVLNEEAFHNNINEGLEFVHENNALLTMGVKPTRPEPGYGYIQIGDYADFDDIYKVKSFTEKPERDFARMFMDSGEWY